MIRVRIERRLGEITGFTVTGHADTAPRGQDIVCAAVSAIVQTALIGIGELYGGPPAEHIAEGDVSWQMAGAPGDNLPIDAILATMRAGLEAIAEDHPEAVSVAIAAKELR